MEKCERGLNMPKHATIVLLTAYVQLDTLVSLDGRREKYVVKEIQYWRKS
jgi:hypothetical protein